MLTFILSVLKGGTFFSSEEEKKSSLIDFDDSIKQINNPSSKEHKCILHLCHLSSFKRSSGGLISLLALVCSVMEGYSLNRYFVSLY